MFLVSVSDLGAFPCLGLEEFSPGFQPGPGLAEGSQNKAGQLQKMKARGPIGGLMHVLKEERTCSGVRGLSWKEALELANAHQTGCTRER